MTAQIIPFPRRPRLAIFTVPLDSIAAVESLDSFGRLADLPCDTEPSANNLRPDSTPIVTTDVLATKGKEPV